MGFAERDYSRQQGAVRQVRGAGFGGGVNMRSVTIWLIIINVAVFLLDRLIRQTVYFDNGAAFVVHPITRLGEFTAADALGRLQLWRFITFQFLHAGVEHLLFNMIALFFFGPLMESYWGAVRYLAFYLLCGIAGPISLLLILFLHILPISGGTGLIGASAGIFGILIAAALVAPDVTVLIYGLFPARMRTVAWVLLAFAVYTVFTNGNNAGGEAAHLGGAVAGYLLLKNPQPLNAIDRLFRRLLSRFLARSFTTGRRFR